MKYKEETLKRLAHQRKLTEERLLENKKIREENRKAKLTAKLDAMLVKWKAKKLAEANKIAAEEGRRSILAELRRNENFNSTRGIIEKEKADREAAIFNKAKFANSIEDIEALMLAKQQGVEEHNKELNKKLYG